MSAFQRYIVSISGLSTSQDVSWKGVPVLIWWGEGSVTLKGRIKIAVQYATKAGEQISWTEHVIEAGQTRTFSNVTGQDMSIYLLETEPTPEPSPEPSPEPTPTPSEDIPSAFQPYIVSISGLSGSQDVSWKGVPVLIWWGEGSVTLKGRIKVAEQHATKAGEQISWDEYVIESGQTRTFSNVTGQDMSIYLLETEPTAIYTCPYCPATFNTQEELDAHIASEHGEEPPPPGKFTWNGCKLLYAGEINVNAVLAAGFNTCMCYINQARLDEALSKGLWIIPSIKDFFPNNLSGAVSFINQWKHHPVIAAWYFLDEPELHGPDFNPQNQQIWYNALKAADPTRDFLTVFTSNPVHPYNNYNPAAFDHCGVDVYPFNTECFNGWKGNWQGYIGYCLERWNRLTNAIRAMAVVQTYHDIPHGMLSPVGNIRGMIDVFHSFGVGKQSDGYAMYCWTDGLTGDSRGISEDAALLSEVKSVNASFPWPHAPPAEITVYTCPYCPATFPSQAELDDHIASEHQVVYTCPYCGATFPSQADLDDHIASEHPTNHPPTPPTSLLCEGEVAPSKVMNLAPKFSAIFNDPDQGDKAKGYLVYVATTKEKLEYDPSRGQPDIWNSEFINIEAQNLYQGQRCLDIAYAGVPLSLNGKTYYWKILFEDVGRAIGGWSSPAQFTMSTAEEPFTCPHCGATFPSQADLDDHIASEHPEETFTTKDITCSLCESVLRITISSIVENNKTLTCLLCEATLPEGGTEAVVVSTPLIDKLRDDIRVFDKQIEQLEATAKDLRTQINTIKEMLGL